MNKTKIFYVTVLHSLGVLLYIVGVGWLLLNGERLFGKMSTLWGPVAFLLLFVVSAVIVGLLILARPALWYFDGHKAEALRFVGYCATCLVVITVVVLLGQIFA